jgi:membrane protein YdbS with pleckstrin-like domain
MLLKLALVEIIFTILIMIMFYILARAEMTGLSLIELLTFQFPIFILFVCTKSYISLVVLFTWLNEYYEIFPDRIIHKRGYFFRNQTKHELADIRRITVEQGVLGKLFNFGTIDLEERFTNIHHYLYQIHNPMRYFKIIEELLPKADEEKHTIREHVIEPDVA